MQGIHRCDIKSYSMELMFSSFDTLENGSILRRFFFFFFRLVNVWRRSPLFWRPERLIGDCLSPPPVREREKERIHRSAPIVQQALHPASHCFYLVSQAGANPCCHGIPHTLVMALQPFCLMISWLIAYLSAWLVLSRCKDIWIL